MKTMPREILSYFYLDFLKFNVINMTSLKLFILLFSNIIIHADAEMYRADEGIPKT
jgi:hypothetical protein